MSRQIADAVLDEILALQITAAWAGEGACVPPRLGWWRTDLVDATGGGDLLARLAPKTHAWASLEAVREAAMRADEKARALLPDADKARTLFFFGFEIDERLSERLAHHKRSGVDPHQALPQLADLRAAFSTDTIADRLRALGSAAEHTVVPGGRQMKAATPDEPLQMARSLAAALVPLANSYPMPFYRLK